MKTKMTQCFELINKKDYKKAVNIAVKFNNVFSKDQIRILEIYSECEKGRSNFYNSIGMDVIENNQKAIELMNWYAGSYYRH